MLHRADRRHGSAIGRQKTTDIGREYRSKEGEHGQNAPSWLVALAGVELLLSEAGGVDCGLLYCLKCCLFFGITRR